MNITSICYFVNETLFSLLGVCCLLWSVHIKKRMEVVAKLINKLGKLPKDRLCVQEVGLSDVQIVTFLQNCVTFLEIFIDVSSL